MRSKRAGVASTYDQRELVTRGQVLFRDIFKWHENISFKQRRILSRSMEL